MNCPTCSRPLPVLRDYSDVDEAVVDRLVHGERVDSSISERIEATRQLTHWGHTRPFIAAQMRVTQRSVARYRHELLLQERSV